MKCITNFEIGTDHICSLLKFFWREERYMIDGKQIDGGGGAMPPSCDYQENRTDLG